MAVLSSPVVLPKERERTGGRVAAAAPSLNSSAAVPLAVFSVPVVLNKSAASANGRISESAVLRSRESPAPTAVLKLPVVMLNNENVPIAVFPRPKVRACKGVVPRSSGEVGIAPGGGGLTACVFWSHEPKAD